MTDVTSAALTRQHFTTKLTIETIKVATSPELGSECLLENENEVVPFIVKTVRPDSKLILKNMEEVLNSVKKKHRQKHRRKKEQKKLAKQEAEAAKTYALIDGEMGGASLDADSEAAFKSMKREKKREKKRFASKSSKLTQENGLKHLGKSKQKEQRSPLKSATANGSILSHLVRTPRKDDEDEAIVVIVDDNTEPTTTATKQVTKSSNKAKPMNAFEVMMNARNKTIGSNTPGIEAPTATNAPKEKATALAKRRLELQEWADKKGGVKRKMDEESRAAYVEKQLENRAKRLKRMLVNGHSPTSNTASESSEKQHEKKEKPNRRTPKSSKLLTSTPIQGEAIQPRASKRGRKQRIVSVDSVESPKSVVDAETAEFLSKLSSPVKKRDSLLGYFVKKDSPQEIAVKTEPQQVDLKAKESVQDTEVCADAGRRQSRRSKAKRAIKVVDSPEIMNETPVTVTVTDVLPIVDEPLANTPSGRPKRSCAGRSRYDYDLEEVNLDVAPVQRKAAKTNKTTKEDASLEVIFLDDSNQNVTPEQTPKKLAPVFMRAVPKPSPDPVALAARQNFLMSGVPEKMRIEMAKQKQYEQNFIENVELYPKLSHVQQYSEDEKLLLCCNFEMNFKLRTIDETEELAQHLVSSSNKKKNKAKSRHSWGVITDCKAKDLRVVNNLLAYQADLCPNAPILNKLDIAKSWKTHFERFPTYKCFNQMRQKYRHFSAIDGTQPAEQVTESFVVTRLTQTAHETIYSIDLNAEEDKPPISAPNGELLFTEKYKPLCFEQVLVNLLPVKQLREFLSNWSSRNGGSARNSQNIDDSFDNFFVNDSSSSQSPCNSIVLVGPVSSGKTNAVYALANDLNFNVLEINAGMKRTGKKLIQDLQEATQSHQILNDVHTPSARSQKRGLQMPLNGLKSKKQQLSQNSDESAEQRKCLILIEDADVVFDQTDAGFTDAIYTLAGSSKRPVILTASNPHCAHLQRLINQNKIQFNQPHPLNISKFMSVLSLMENCPVNMDDLVSLFLYNRNDLRKTLMELQFFIQSGGDRQSARTRHFKEALKQKKSFASPTKQETNTAATQAEDLANNDATKDLYMHTTLFEFYTVGQNVKYRVPFPVDFQLLRNNINDMLKVSSNLKTIKESKEATQEQDTSITKRKTRSPKKVWLKSATTIDKQTKSPLEVLSDFYENISCAALCGTRNGENSCTSKVRNMSYFVNRLAPNLCEEIAHELVERSIEVNLAAAICPYNHFDVPLKRQTISEHFNTGTMLTLHARNLDYEPALRAICRSEKHRSQQERRSTRFYHYLRNSSIQPCFTMQQFDGACKIFQSSDFDNAMDS